MSQNISARDARTVDALNIISSELKNRFSQITIKKILLINPPTVSEDVFDISLAKRKRYSAFPPYGLLVIAEHLRKNGFEVEVLDLQYQILSRVHAVSPDDDFQYTQEWKLFLEGKIEEFQPDLVGVTCMFTMTHNASKEVVREVKALRNIPVVLGGVHVTNNTSDILRDISVADIACTHEAEVSFIHLLCALNGEGAWGGLSNISMVIHGAYYEVGGLEGVPKSEINIIPAFDLVDINNYSQVGSVGSFLSLLPDETRAGTVLANRGCRGKCTFCSVRSFNGAGVRSRSVDSTADEISILYNEYGISHIMWLDDDLFVNGRTTVALFNEIVRRGLKITWDASNGVIAAALTPEIMQASAESGCIGLNFGFESGNPAMLRKMRKPGTIEDYLRAAELCKKYPQVSTRGFLMMGFPDETFGMMTETMELAVKMQMDWYNITILQPLPSTELGQGLPEDGITEEVKYNIGPFGKQNESEKRQDGLVASFAEEFSHLRPNVVPTKDQLSHIWLYMNYVTNFARIKDVHNPIKQKMLHMHVKNIADRITEKHGFAHYFTGILEEKLGNLEEAKRRAELTRVSLENSAYWRDKFSAFGLDAELTAFKSRIGC